MMAISMELLNNSSIAVYTASVICQIEAIGLGL